MSGAVAAHAAYNGSGTQGLAVTNKIQEEGDVTSVFWNKNDTTRQLLHGSTILEVPASGNNGNVDFGGSKIFTINNDIDCLGDIYVNMKVNITNNFTLDGFKVGGAENYAGATGSLAGNYPKIIFKPGALTNILERIEFQVGTQIWQTLERDDVRVVYNTELSEGALNTVDRRSVPTTNGVHYVTSSANNYNGAGKDLDVTFIIPSLTKTLAPQLETFSNNSENGYPLAAAPHQTIKLKFYFSPLSNVRVTLPDANAGEDVIAPAFDNPYIDELHLPSDGTNGFQAADSTAVVNLGPSPLALKSVKVYAKHIIMCNEEREQMKSMPLGIPKRLKMTQSSVVTDLKGVMTKTIDLDHFSLYGSHLIIAGDLGYSNFSRVQIKTAELKLNSSSYSGVLPAQLLDYASSQSLGLFNNRRLINFSASEPLGGVAPLVFPLASTAYSGSSVPLNRFDSIRLTLTFTGQPQGDSPYLNITCVGETTALFKGGAASLAMY